MQEYKLLMFYLLNAQAMLCIYLALPIKSGSILTRIESLTYRHVQYCIEY